VVVHAVREINYAAKKCRYSTFLFAIRASNNHL